MIVPASPSRDPADAPNKTRIRRAQRHTRKVQRQLERAIGEGKIGKAEYLQRRFLSSFDAKLTECIRANKKLPRHQRVHKTRLVQHAEAINPWVRCNELVHAYARPKSNGSFRPILSYGIQGRTLQRLLKRSMQPFLRADPRQHATANGGRNVAVAKILEELRAGRKWFVRLDIREFYQQIDERRLTHFVPAPQGVILNTLGPPKNIVLRQSSLTNSPDALLRKCRKGLSQGASSSPIIADMVVAWILTQIPSDACVINYADDFAVMARTKREAVALSVALASAVRRCPFGELQLEPKSTLRRVSDGFEFLGYYFRYRSSRLTCEPTLANKIRFLVNIGRMLNEPSARPLERTRKLRRFVHCWRTAFSQWDAGADMLAIRIWLVQLPLHVAELSGRSLAEAIV